MSQPGIEAASAPVPRSASYREGEWFGIFGEHATVVLPPSEKARAARIWALVDDGAGFDEVLDALISDGLRDLPGFVLVSESDGETKVVIRGPARAEFATGGDPVSVEGSSVTTWTERSLRDVRAMRIDVADSGAAEDLVIRDGLVRIARIDRPAVAAAPTETGEVAEVADAPTSPPVPAELLDETAYYPGPPAPLAQPELAPGPLAWPVARLVFSSGEVVDVDRAVVVGRAPEARRATSTDEPRLVTVSSPHQEISSTHLEIRPEGGAAVVTDLGSTNGTVLQQPGLPPEDLRAGVAVQLAPGALIDLGDGVTIQVDPA